MSESPAHIFLLGIGGIGMSALARYFNATGHKVAGYDKTSTELTKKLESEGMKIIFDDEVNAVPKEFLHRENCRVIFTPAVPKHSKLFQHYNTSGYLLNKRAEVLGEISRKYHTIAVAGTHGKTTISILIAHLLKSSGIKVNALLGGISHNFGSNVLLDDNADLLITEADEYDQSFLKLYPNIAVISSVDADHLDIYGEQQNMLNSYSLFAKQVPQDGLLLSKPAILKELNIQSNSISYSIESSADYTATNIRSNEGHHQFDLVAKGVNIKNLECGIPGFHNIENSVAAIAVALHFGADSNKIKEALKNFKGVKRRFDVHVKNDRKVYIDDYAHHPKEIEALLKSVRALYPNKKITGIFQPHLFSRTRDFADDFAKSLSLLDELIILDIYPAREEAIEGITSEWLLQKVGIGNKKLCTLDAIMPEIKRPDIEVLLTIGAGNIDQLVQPIKKTLEEC